MSQTALNLIAISVFLLTFSSLLGPWLQISPLVPAIATVVTLGLAAVDTWNWQGRGATLMLDWVTRRLGGREYETRIAHHEAGHFLVAHLLGIPITGYTLNAWEAFRQGHPGQGGVAFEAPVPLEDLSATQEVSQTLSLTREQYTNTLLDRYCIIWMAGSVAETLIYNQAEGGADDRQKFRSLWLQLGHSATDCQQKERWSALQAKTLLQEHWPAYEALVEAMLQRAAVADCCQLIQQHRQT